MAAKRKLTKEFSLISTVEPKVEGVVATLSPLKKGKNKECFEGKSSDGDTCTSIRLVGFDRSHRDQLDDFHEKQESVELLDCQVKRDSKSNEWQIFLAPYKGQYFSQEI